jgi:hypothetical protein
MKAGGGRLGAGGHTKQGRMCAEAGGDPGASIASCPAATAVLGSFRLLRGRTGFATTADQSASMRLVARPVRAAVVAAAGLGAGLAGVTICS